MDTIEIPPVLADVRPDPPRHGRAAPLAALQVERLEVGIAVSGPGFRVWGEDERAALQWARELALALPGRRRVPSPSDPPS